MSAGFFAQGFRPFFLLGALHAAAMVARWVPVHLGLWEAPGALPPLAWHSHELLFGTVPAIAAGFLLTAMPNWTGRKRLAGLPVMLLVALWLLGRLAISGVLPLPGAGPAHAALAFPVVLAGLAAWEIVAARNWRNLKVAGALTLLALAQAGFHAELRWTGAPLHAERAALAAVVLLVTIVAGRIVPAFTGNWLRQRNPGAMPAPFGTLDRLAMIAGGGALVLWVIDPLAARLPAVLALVALVAAGLHGARLARWQGHRTLAEPLVTVLHAAYGFAPLGFLLLAIAAWLGTPAAMAAAIHAWTVGLIGTMTLAVMTRATRGHSGRPLTAPVGTRVIYGLILAAAVARIVAAFTGGAVPLAVAGAAWVGAYLLFAALYAPMLMGRPGPSP